MLDTIIAPATPPGVAALALIRVSGAHALRILQSMTRPQREWIPRMARHLVLRYQNKILDNVIAIWWQAPASFTGEDVVEITCHGNPKIVESIVSAFLKQGARLARPGEFTERAYLNGKVDFTQAEGIFDLLHAGSQLELDNARKIHDGKLGEKLIELRQNLIDQLAHLEAHIDFPEEDISPDTGNAFIQGVKKIRDEIQRLISTAPTGKILREGIRTAIVGRPNVGKSSLLNTLLREKRAIVSAIPGTTRDTIEAECEVRGLRLVLIDTAGQRETADEIESEGIERARQALRSAQLVLHLIEAHQPEKEQLIDLSELPDDCRVIKVGTKSDLGIHSENQHLLHISTVTGNGMERLLDEIGRVMLQGAAVEQPGWLAVNARQAAALEIALMYLDQALNALADQLPPEWVSLELRNALDAIADVIGRADNEDVLDSLFAKFCLGK